MRPFRGGEPRRDKILLNTVLGAPHRLLCGEWTAVQAEARGRVEAGCRGCGVRLGDNQCGREGAAKDSAPMGPAEDREQGSRQTDRQTDRWGRGELWSSAQSSQN